MKKFITVLAVLAILTAGCRKENMEIEVTGISMEKSLALETGQTVQLIATPAPDNATETVELTWRSSDDAIAAVTEAGEVTALKEGKATITAQVKNKTSVTASCAITVLDEVEEDFDIVFEDPKFAALVLYYDKNNDGKLQASEARVVKELHVRGNNIGSLKGIEYFTSLELLSCSVNNLQALDISQNTALKKLYCFYNKLEALDVSTLTELEILSAGSNRLQGTVDVSKNAKLKELRLDMNWPDGIEKPGITTVDVSQNPDLEVLDIYYTCVSELDVTNNHKLRYLNIGHNCHTMWSFRDRLPPLSKVDLSQCPELEYLNATGSNIRPGTGPYSYDFYFGLDEIDVTHNPKLKHLVTYGQTKITKLDLSNNPALTHLNCSHNTLTELDITHCPLLDTMSCHWNQLTALDLTNSAALVYIDCADNEIGALDFSNTRLGYLLANDNKIAVINMGAKTFDTPGGNDKQPYLYMKLNDNLIESIDLSKQSNLKWLEIKNNKLTTLDVSGCLQLHGLLCSGNRLTELILDGVNDLWELDFSNNSLSGAFDLSGHGGKKPGTLVDNLGKIAAQGNQLTTIYVWDGFNANCSYYLGGIGSLPCYTKDTSTEWTVK